MSGRKIEDYVEGLQNSSFEENFNTDREPRGRANADSRFIKKDTLSMPRNYSLADPNKTGALDVDRPSARSIEDFDETKNVSNSASR